LRIKGLSVIREFDPWNSPLCTCPHKFTLNPYTGCAHGCLYCYARSYIKDFDHPRPKKNLISRLIKDLRKLPEGLLISMSESSDPYTPPEKVLGISREAIKQILNHGMRLLIVTKSDLVMRDADLLRDAPASVSITITTLSDSLAKEIEPGAPPPTRRLQAIKELSREGIPVTVRVDPIIPGVNDSRKEIIELIDAVAEAGAKQITTSTYKARWDSLKRLSNVFPELRKKLYRIYVDEGIRMGGYFYLQRGLRLNYIMTVREEAMKEGLAFATCREGFQNLHTPGIYCDGSTYTYLRRTILLSKESGLLKYS